MSIPKLTLAKTYRKGACPIAFIDYQKDNTSDSLIIDNVADHLEHNTPSRYYYEKVELVSDEATPKMNINYYPSGHILVSDKVILTSDKKAEVPLFWSYELKWDHVSESEVPGVGIQIYRDDGVILDHDSIMFEFASGSLASDYTQRWNTSYWDSTPILNASGDLTTQRVRILMSDSLDFENRWYQASYSKSSYGEIVDGYLEFINPRKIYSQDEDYTIDVDGVITFTGSGYLYVKKDNATSIYLKKPIRSNSREGWYVMVNGGSIVMPSGVANETEDIYTTEYGASGQPKYVDDLIMMSNKELVEIRDNMYQVPRGPVYVGELTQPYIINDLDDGISTVASGTIGLNIYVDGNRIKNGSLIEDIQLGHGIILTKSPLKNGALTVSYLMESKDVICSNLDMNPTINHYSPGIEGQLVKNSRARFYVTKASGAQPSGNVMWNWDFQDEDKGYYSFGNRDQQTIPSGSIYIGSAFVKTIPSDSIDIIDIRRRGGILPEYEWKSSESRFYYDIANWDGKFFPTVSTLIIQLPIKVLDDLTESYETEGYDPTKARELAFEYVTSVIERNLPAGTGYILVDENHNLWPIQQRSTYV